MLKRVGLGDPTMLIIMAGRHKERIVTGAYRLLDYRKVTFCRVDPFSRLDILGRRLEEPSIYCGSHHRGEYV